MSNQWYTFNSEAVANAALDFINGSGWFPLEGVNKGTGAIEKDATTCWAKRPPHPILCLDGKWRFPRIPEYRLDLLGVSAEDRQSFLSAFNPTIEEYSRDWFPVNENDEP